MLDLSSNPTVSTLARRQFILAISTGIEHKHCWFHKVQLRLCVFLLKFKVLNAGYCGPPNVLLCSQKTKSIIFMELRHKSQPRHQTSMVLVASLSFLPATGMLTFWGPVTCHSFNVVNFCSRNVHGRESIKTSFFQQSPAYRQTCQNPNKEVCMTSTQARERAWRAEQIGIQAGLMTKR